MAVSIKSRFWICSNRPPNRYHRQRTFPGQSLSRTDVFRTLYKMFEYFGMFMYSKKNDELSCAPCTYDYTCCWLFYSLRNYFSFIIVSVRVAFIFHLITTEFTLYPLLDALPNSPRILSLLQAYKNTSVDAPYRVNRPIELVFTHIMYMKIP